MVGLKRSLTVSLALWIPGMVLLALAAFAFLFACIPACDKI